MSKLLKFAFVLFFASNLQAAEAKIKYFGDENVPPSIGQAYAKEIGDVEHYMDSYQSIVAAFKQSNRQGRISYGKLLISKPGKIRCEYLEPSKVLLLINNNKVTLYDYDLDETSHASMDTNALKLLAQNNIKFSELNLVELEKDNHFLSLSVKDFSKEMKQNIIVTFKFSYPSVELKQISIFTEDNEVDIVLEQLAYNQVLSNSLFHFNRGLIKR